MSNLTAGSFCFWDILWKTPGSIFWPWVWTYKQWLITYCFLNLLLVSEKFRKLDWIHVSMKSKLLGLMEDVVVKCVVVDIAMNCVVKHVSWFRLSEIMMKIEEKPHDFL
jgi:hypothetical protein